MGNGESTQSVARTQLLAARRFRRCMPFGSASKELLRKAHVPGLGKHNSYRFSFAICLQSLHPLPPGCAEVAVQISRRNKCVISRLEKVRDGQALFNTISGTLEFVSTLSRSLSGTYETKLWLLKLKAPKKQGRTTLSAMQGDTSI